MDEVRLNKDSSSKHHMIGGDGPNSYVRNSEYQQKQLLISAEDLLQEQINKHLDPKNPNFDPHNTFRIADFGSSVGPNAFFAVENIVASVKTQYKSDQKNTLEFHVFFNDIIGNDFNTLFKNLSPSSRNYFCAAVAGSFHGRLFPNGTLHFAHCSTALHWLSRIPEEVAERSSTAWNKGRIHYSGAGKEVRDAYTVQYKKDMEAFLKARGDELVHGGLMALVILGFPDGYVLSSDCSIGGAFDILRSCLDDMAKMGKIRSEEKVESFNLPFYYPTPSELKALIEANGLFHIETIAELAAPMRGKPDAQILTRHLRAVIGVLVEEHFGSGMVEELFQLHLEKLRRSPILVDSKYWKGTNYFVFLKRNA